MRTSSSANLLSYFAYLIESGKSTAEVPLDLKIESTSLHHHAACVSDVVLSGQLEGTA